MAQASQSPPDYTGLAQELVRASAEKDFPALAGVLAPLDPTRVDVMVMIHSPTTHLTIMGAYRSLSLPRDPQAIPGQPTIAEIAWVLEEVAR
ncbi:MAG TPA: hypothetical protein VFA32_24250 [Dehalococcoidia bacterium]|jgi:hypothetical protein|nr:hypothetical protein [Dehalococcoidia bacterium]